MKQIRSPFYSDSFQLSILDIFTLIFGGEVKCPGTIIGLWRLPDNGCSVEERLLDIRKDKAK